MQLKNPLQEYLEANTTAPSQVLQDLERQTHLKMLNPHMIAGAYQGEFLRFFSLMVQPKNVLEIGTYTGYAAICLAAGLQPNGLVHTIEVNEEQEDFIREHLNKAGLKEKVKLYIGDALEIIPTIEGLFDVVFIDANKRHNEIYYDLLFDRLSIGGYIITDNILWHNLVYKKSKDKDAQIISSYTQKIHQDPRVENIALPIRDGILIARKISK